MLRLVSLCLLGALVFSPAPVAADAVFVASSPAIRGLVGPPIDTLEIVFNEVVTEAAITVSGPEGLLTPTESVREGRIVSLSFDPIETEGVYEVRYSVISVDTDPVSGGFQFTVQEGAPAPLPASSIPIPDEGISGLTLVAGAVAGGAVVAIGLQTMRRTRRLRQLTSGDGVPSTG